MSSEQMRSMSGRQWQIYAERLGHIYVPEASHPIVALAILKHHIKGGALFYRPPEELDGLVRADRYFGSEQFLWDHLSEFFDMFDFGVDEREVDVAWGSTLSYIMTSVGLLGPHAAFRLWCAHFSEAIAGLEVRFERNEPVANLVVTGDVRQHGGWNQHFPAWNHAIKHTMDYSLDQERYQTLAMVADHTPVDSFVRVMLSGVTKFVYANNHIYSKHALPAGEASIPTIGLDAARKFPTLFTDKSVEADRLNIAQSYGESMFDMDGVMAWNEAAKRLRHDALARPPVYPVAGRTKADLAYLDPVHKFGSVRPVAGGGHTKHSGLDLVNPLGSPLVAPYDGEVVGIKNDHPAGSVGDAETNPAGNWIQIRHRVPGIPNYTFDSFYAHMHPTKDPSSEIIEQVRMAFGGAGKAITSKDAEQRILEANKLKRGDKVSAGQLVGLMGDTGNSSGAHLHWSVTASERDPDTGRSIDKKTVDPELVIEHGLLAAARSSGITVGAPPVLGEAVFTMNMMASKGKALIPGGAQRTALDAHLRSTLDGFKEQRFRNGLEVIKAGDGFKLKPVFKTPVPQGLPRPATASTPAAPSGSQGTNPAVKALMSGPIAEAALGAALAAIGVPPPLVPSLQASLMPVYRQLLESKATPIAARAALGDAVNGLELEDEAHRPLVRTAVQSLFNQM